MYRIVLDFDDCIFDTARLKEIAEECGIPQSERTESMFDRIRDTAGYEDFDPKDLIFEDALEFIERYADRITVLTTSTSMTIPLEEQDNVAAEKFQRMKVAESKIADMGIADVRYVPGEKQEALEEIKSEYKNVVFMDDRKAHVESGVLAGVFSFWLQRKRVSPSVEMAPESIEGAKIVTSFTELRREIEGLESE